MGGHQEFACEEGGAKRSLPGGVVERRERKLAPVEDQATERRENKREDERDIDAEDAPKEIFGVWGLTVVPDGEREDESAEDEEEDDSFAAGDQWAEDPGRRRASIDGPPVMTDDSDCSYASKGVELRDAAGSGTRILGSLDVGPGMLHALTILFAAREHARSLARWRDERKLFCRGCGCLLLRLSGHVFGDELGLEADDGVGVGDDGLGVVLGDVTGASGFAVDDEGAFAGCGPVGRAFGGNATVGDESLGVGDLVGGGFTDNEVGIVGGEVVFLVGGEKSFFVNALGLAAVERDEHGDGRVEGLLHEDVVELGVVEAEHVEVKRDGDAGEDVFEDVVDIVAADVEEMDVFAGNGGVGGLFGVLGEVGESKGLEALGGVAEDVARALLGGLGVIR